MSDKFIDIMPDIDFRPDGKDGSFTVFITPVPGWKFRSWSIPTKDSQTFAMNIGKDKN